MPRLRSRGALSEIGRSRPSSGDLTRAMAASKAGVLLAAPRSNDEVALAWPTMICSSGAPPRASPGRRLISPPWAMAVDVIAVALERALRRRRADVDGGQRGDLVETVEQRGDRRREVEVELGEQGLQQWAEEGLDHAGDRADGLVEEGDQGVEDGLQDRQQLGAAELEAEDFTLAEGLGGARRAVDPCLAAGGLEAEEGEQGRIDVDDAGLGRCFLLVGAGGGEGADRARGEEQTGTGGLGRRAAGDLDAGRPGADLDAEQLEVERPGVRRGDEGLGPGLDDVVRRRGRDQERAHHEHRQGNSPASAEHPHVFCLPIMWPSPLARRPRPGCSYLPESCRYQNSWSGSSPDASIFLL